MTDIAKDLADALRPFAEFIGPNARHMPDDYMITKGSPLARNQLTAGQCRRAAEALARYEAEREMGGCDGLMVAVEKAYEWFSSYAENHYAKGTIDGDAKGSVNATRAEYMERALAAHRAKPLPPGPTP